MSTAAVPEIPTAVGKRIVKAVESSQAEDSPYLRGGALAGIDTN
ncbi:MULTISPECIES: hypothetical protein [unclassified Rhodococcus (in: high G+C Gram-positive bacteria)]|nr:MULTISPECIES: hypothetical protein [unclassified Rhodococcus (in: high G+C Gram-positive bacteria)]